MKIIKKVNVFPVIIAMMLVYASSSFAQIKIYPSVGLGSQSLKFSSENYSTSGSFGFNLGGDVFINISEDMAIGGGIHFVSYGASSTLSDFEFTEPRTDIDGHDFDFSVAASNVKEDYELSVLEIPILFKYDKWISPSLTVTASAGPVVLIPGKFKGDYKSGEIVTSGFYPQWNVTINDIQEYGFYNRELAGQEILKFDAKTSLGFSFEIGAEYFLNNKVDLYVAAYFQNSLGSIYSSIDKSAFLSDPTVLESGLQRSPDVKLSKVGIKLGLSIDLTPPEKAGVKSIR